MRGLLMLLMCVAPVAARAFDTLAGGSYAATCASQADNAARELATGPADAISVCSKAITDEGLSPRDLAATFVNRGVLYLAASTPAVAERDFRSAIAINASSGEAYVDLGAAEIAQNRPKPGIADIDHGLSLAAKEPEKGYFNRAMAEDSLGEASAAYRDFRTALQLRPGWTLPEAELTRFTVKSVP